MNDKSVKTWGAFKLQAENVIQDSYVETNLISLQFQWVITGISCYAYKCSNMEQGKVEIGRCDKSSNGSCYYKRSGDS